MIRRSYAALRNVAQNKIYACLIIIFTMCSTYTPSSSCNTSDWKSVAGLTALAASDLLITVGGLYVSYACDEKQPSEPCNTWQRMLLPTVITATGATAITLTYYTIEKLKAWSANHSSQTTQSSNENV